MPRKKTDDRNHDTRPKPYTGDWRLPGIVYVGNLMYHLNLSRSGVRDAMIRRRIPQPDGRTDGRPYWYTQTIAPLLGVSPSTE